MHRGFSLVELSIVLVILGLLTGGILAGQSLIRAAELRAINTEIHKYTAAIYTFRDKYFYLPGDMNNATRFWGAADGGTGFTTACADIDSLTLADTRLTCNGDANGMLDYPAHSAEPNRAWQHMANAGLVEGAYSGLNSTIYGTTPGGNVPRSKLNNLVIGFGWWPSSNTSGIYTGSATHFDGYYGNVFPLQGGRNNSLSPPQNRILRPEEMWNVDAKLDDGIPHMGKFRARKGFGCTLNDATAPEYALSVKDIVCNGSYNL